MKQSGERCTPWLPDLDYDRHGVEPDARARFIMFMSGHNTAPTEARRNVGGWQAGERAPTRRALSFGSARPGPGHLGPRYHPVDHHSAECSEPDIKDTKRRVFYRNHEK